MPAKKVNQHGCNPEIENVICWRCSALNEHGKNHDLECIRNDRQCHGDSKARTRRNYDGVVSQTLPAFIFVLDSPFYAAKTVASSVQFTSTDFEAEIIHGISELERARIFLIGTAVHPLNRIRES